MKEKKFATVFLAATALIVVLTVLKDAFSSAYILGAFNAVFSPLALIAAIYGAYVAFKDKVTVTGKGIWGVVAIAFALALKHFAYVSGLVFLPDASVKALIADALYTLGFAGVVVALLEEKAKKILPIAFGVLVVAAVLKVALVEAALYGVLAFMTYSPEYAYNYIIRRIAVILAVGALPTAGILGPVCWILFAFILVPAGKFVFSFRKLTAILCVLVAVAGLIGFVAGNPMKAVEQRKTGIESVEMRIEQTEEQLVTLQDKLTADEQALQTKKADLEQAKTEKTAADAALEDANAALSTAEANLRKVCYRSYYSSYYCPRNGCSRSLHDAVDNAGDEVNAKQRAVSAAESAVSQLESDIVYLESEITNTKQNIVNAEQNLESLKTQLESLKAQLSVDYFALLISGIAALVFAAGLGYLGICLFAQKEEKQHLLACAGLALGSLLFVVVYCIGRSLTVGYLLANPYTWAIAIAVFFAAVIAKKGGKPVKFRVLAIIAAILSCPAAVAAGAAIGAPFLLFAAAAICVALVLVPPVFTEYNGIGKHIFYTIISGGIWQLIWTYHVTKNLNKVEATVARKPALELVLCIFLPFYYTYWLLKTAENVEAYAAEKGEQFKLDIVCLAFAFLCPLVSTVLIQNKINLIVGKPE